MATHEIMNAFHKHIQQRNSDNKEGIEVNSVYLRYRNNKN